MCVHLIFHLHVYLHFNLADTVHARLHISPVDSQKAVNLVEVNALLTLGRGHALEIRSITDSSQKDDIYFSLSHFQKEFPLVIWQYPAQVHNKKFEQRTEFTSYNTRFEH